MIIEVPASISRILETAKIKILLSPKEKASWILEAIIFFYTS
jgi:hypothetical protein